MKWQGIVITTIVVLTLIGSSFLLGGLAAIEVSQQTDELIAYGKAQATGPYQRSKWVELLEPNEEPDKGIWFRELVDMLNNGEVQAARELAQDLSPMLNMKRPDENVYQSDTAKIVARLNELEGHYLQIQRTVDEAGLTPSGPPPIPSGSE